MRTDLRLGAVFARTICAVLLSWQSVVAAQIQKQESRGARATELRPGEIPMVVAGQSISLTFHVPALNLSGRNVQAMVEGHMLFKLSIPAPNVKLEVSPITGKTIAPGVDLACYGSVGPDLILRAGIARDQPAGRYKTTQFSVRVNNYTYTPNLPQLAFDVLPDPTYAPFVPPEELSGTIEFNLTKVQLLQLRIRALQQSLRQLDDDLTGLRNGSAVRVRERLLRSVHDESARSSETEQKYLDLTPDPRSKSAVLITFAEVQQRYDFLEKALQNDEVVRSIKKTLLVSLPQTRLPDALSQLQEETIQAITNNEDCFEALADHGDTIANVVVETEPEQGASVVCRTPSGKELEPNGFTNTIFEFFPYAHWHCRATKSNLKGETDYNSVNDSHHLIRIFLK